MTNKYALNDQVVLVTGGGSGIGRAIAQGFLDNGAKVAVLGRRQNVLEETVQAYDATKTLVIVGDISQPATAQMAVDQTVAQFGKLDIVVSDAAAFAADEIANLTQEDWQKVRATNIDGFFYLAKASYSALKATKGTLIAVSSVSGSNGDWQQSIYNASKHAVNGFVKSLALDWGKDGIRVNAVAPAFTLTDMTKDMAQSDEQLKPFINRIALQRPGRPADIAPAVLFLASSDASYITGTILTVDGGTTASTGQPHIE